MFSICETSADLFSMMILALVFNYFHSSAKIIEIFMNSAWYEAHLILDMALAYYVRKIHLYPECWSLHDRSTFPWINILLYCTPIPERMEYLWCLVIFYNIFSLCLLFGLFSESESGCPSPTVSGYHNHNLPSLFISMLPHSFNLYFAIN